MSRLLETARRQVAAGKYGKALDMLSTAEARLRLETHGFAADLAEAQGLLDLATQVEGRVSEETLRRQSRELVVRAQAAISYLHNPPGSGKAAAMEGVIAVVECCEILGGSGLPPRPGQRWELIFRTDTLVLWNLTNQRVDVPYEDIVALEIGGRGATQSGGGFMGGGFGLEGALTGMLVATALNMLTTSTEIDTVLCLKTRSAELYVHLDAETPAALRMSLSPVFTALRQRDAANTAGTSIENRGGPLSVTTELERLADLHDRGKLTDEEFAWFKTRLMS